MPEIPPSDSKQPIETLVCLLSGRRSRRRAKVFLYSSWLAIAGLFLAWLPMIRHRFFDPDELEHAHGAWCVAKGMLPYKDFFEHHTPWYHYALRPFFHWFDVAGSLAGATHFLFFGRGLSLGLAMLSVFLTTQIGRIWDRRETGLLAGVFLAGQPIFFQKGLEMRPDVLALPFFLGCLWLLLRELARRTVSTARTARHFFGAGLSLGAAIMCTQKMLFVLPGVLCGLVLWSLSGQADCQLDGSSDQRSGAAVLRRMMLGALFAVGVCVPAAGTWAGFAVHHAGDVFIANNFLLNAQWKEIVTHQFGWLIDTSWPILASSLLGAGICLWRFFQRRIRFYGGLLLLCTLAGLFAGLLVIPSAHSQYYLMPLPIACLFAAKAVLFVVGRLETRARPVALATMLMALAVLPILTLRETFGMRNDGQLARLRYVFENTRPDDVVMDGWQGMGVFRPHAFHYFFLHPETVAMLPRPAVEAYLSALERGQIQPRLIVLDRNLFALGPRFLGFLKSNYATRDGFFYFPNRGFWRSDQGGILRSIRGL